jgi:outer membrane receptor protein involved in Fe transport
VDLNSIPPGAVERIEVLQDGASAIYGSDAIAGVVNIITRKNFNGTEATAQYGISDKGDAQTFDAQVSTGRSGDLGNFFFTATYFNQKESWLRDRDWSAHALNYDYAANKVKQGGSGRTPQGTIALPTNTDGTETAQCKANPVCHALATGDPNFASDNFILCKQGETGCMGMNPLSPYGFRIFTGADRYNYAAENYLTVPATRVQVFSSGDTKFNLVRGYYEASYTQRNTQQNAAPMPLNPGDYFLGDGVTPISLSADNIYNPFGVATCPAGLKDSTKCGVPLPFSGRRLLEFGRRTYTEELATFRIVTGLDGTLPDAAGPLHGWYWDASMNYGRTSGNFTTGGALRNSRVAGAVGPSLVIKGVPQCVGTPGDPTTVIPGCVPINLLGGPNNGSINPSQINYLGYSGVSRAFDAMFVVAANTTGELFTIASDRPVSLALGYEFRRQSGAQIADPIAASGDSADFNFASTQGHFQSNEAYAELSIPLIANIQGVRDLELDAAGRYVNYDTFGSNLSGKFGARYTPIPDITLRGTFSSAFRAPSISELYLGQTDSGPTATDPCVNLNAPGVTPQLKAQCIAAGVPAGGSADTGQQELAHVGGNPQLQPETATTFTAGVVLQPQAVKDLSITVDYYNITVDNLVGTIGAATIIAGCYTGTSTQNLDYCKLITRGPTSLGGRILFVKDVNQNVGQLKTSGIDLSIRYAMGSPVGRFVAGFDGNYLGNFDRTQTGVTIHGKGIYDLGVLPAYKANLGLNWANAGFTAGAIARYVGTFRECSTPAPDLGSSGGLCSVNDPTVTGRQVGHYITFDAHVGYTVASPLGKTFFNVGVNNVFDQAPPFVYSANLANSDPTAYDFLGRYVYGRVTQNF